MTKIPIKQLLESREIDSLVLKEISLPSRDDEKTKFLKFAENPDLYQTIHNILAPEIFGHDIIKQAIACLLFGGVRKVSP